MRVRRFSVRVSVLLALLVVAGATVGFLRREDHAPTAATLLQEHANAPPAPLLAGPLRPQTVRASSPGPKTPARAAKIPRWRSRGTRFQTRLEHGKWLRALRDGLAEDRFTPKQVLDALHKYGYGFMPLERYWHRIWSWKKDRSKRPSKKKLLAWLRGTLTPSRDREALALHGTRDPIDEWGDELLVRVWTPAGRAFPPYEIAQAESLIQRLDGIAGTRSRDGYDVLATEHRGADVFPMLYMPRYVIGVFFRRDRLAIIGTKHSALRRQLLLNHELLHAWRWNAWEDRWTSRFVSEGMAEYLAWVRALDRSLDVPDERLRDNMALVVRIADRLAACGADMENFPLAKLVDTTPWGFYSLGWFAYGIAQACYAYIPPETLEDALRTGREGVLRSAFRRIDWKDLLAWMRGAAEGGNHREAAFIADPSDDEASERGGYAPRALLQSLFGDIDPLTYADAVRGREEEEPFAASERVKSVVDALRTTDAGTFHAVVDATKAIVAPMEIRDWTHLRGPSMPRSNVRSHHLVDGLLAHLAWRDPGNGPARGLRRRVDRVGAGTKIGRAPGEQPTSKLLSLTALSRHLASRATRSDDPWVLFIGARDDVTRMALLRAIAKRPKKAAAPEGRLERALAYHVLSHFASARWSPRPVLVVDLSDGMGEARAVAAALDRAAPEHLHVAYWNPQSDR